VAPSIFYWWITRKVRSYNIVIEATTLPNSNTIRIDVIKTPLFLKKRGIDSQSIYSSNMVVGTEHPTALLF
jgi:hypothetical protein